MAKPEWGTKRICQSCGARFYDLRKSPIVCPKCGAEVDPLALLRPQRTRPAPAAPVVKPAAPVEDADAEVDGDATEGEDAEEEEETIEDASELGEDKDDVSEVIENAEEEDER